MDKRPKAQLSEPWFLPQQFLYFLPLPHGHGSLRPTFGVERTIWMEDWAFALAELRAWTACLAAMLENCVLSPWDSTVFRACTGREGLA